MPVWGGGAPQAPATRLRCGTISGAAGIFLNVLLFLGKVIAGTLTSSVAMVADAVNNLSDAATSVVTLIGFRLAGQEADEDHPFGHGRVEYIAGLIGGDGYSAYGVEVGRSALESLFGQSETQFSPVALVILAAAILVKFWMYWFNRGLGRAIDSAAMEATAADSLSDCLSTGVVLLSTLADHFWGLQVDGLAGRWWPPLFSRQGGRPPGTPWTLCWGGPWTRSSPRTSTASCWATTTFWASTTWSTTIMAPVEP